MDGELVFFNWGGRRFERGGDFFNFGGRGGYIYTERARRGCTPRPGGRFLAIITRTSPSSEGFPTLAIIQHVDLLVNVLFCTYRTWVFSRVFWHSLARYTAISPPLSSTVAALQHRSGVAAALQRALLACCVQRQIVAHSHFARHVPMSSSCVAVFHIA